MSNKKQNSDSVLILLSVLSVMFYITGLVIGGFIGYNLQIQNLNTNTITTIPPISTYQGTVEAIYTNHPSAITFTSGTQYIGNLSTVSNLSIGSVCTLVLNESNNNEFSNGYCK